MKKAFLLLPLWVGWAVHAQDVQIKYDSSGNQIQRTICVTCKTASTVSKQISEVTNEEFIKDKPQDLFSYYPNPVKEQLYIKWGLGNEKIITSVELYNLNGQKLIAFENLEQKENQIIDFNKYPTGYYLVVVNYSDNDKKTLRIVKGE